MATKNIVKNEKKETQLRSEIYQTNPLINARKGMGIMELRIFSLGLSGVNPHISTKDKYYDEEFKEIFITPKKLVEIFGNPKYLNELKKACKNLFNAMITLDNEDGGWELQHIFHLIKYKPKQGLFIQFDNTMKPYILNLFESGGYTRINIEQIFPLSSTYAWRIVELLLQYQGTKQKVLKRKITVEDIRFALAVPAGSYKDMSSFKKNVLDNPIKEINSKTFYTVSYETVKANRKVVAFNFYMDTSKAEQMENNENSIKIINFDSIKKLIEVGFQERTATKLNNLCDNDDDCINRLNYALEQLKKYANRNKPVNKLGFIRRAIEENWYQREKEKNIAGITTIWNDLDALYFNDDTTYSGGEIPLSDKDISLLKHYYCTKGYWTSTAKDIFNAHNLTVRRFEELYLKL